jgi:hypothetical protein
MRFRNKGTVAEPAKVNSNGTNVSLFQFIRQPLDIGRNVTAAKAVQQNDDSVSFLPALGSIVMDDQLIAIEQIDNPFGRGVPGRTPAKKVASNRLKMCLLQKSMGAKGHDRGKGGSENLDDTGNRNRSRSRRSSFPCDGK